MSPWRGKGPRDSSESVSPSDEPDVKLAGEEERSDECGSAATEERQKEVEEEESSLGPSRSLLGRGSLSQEEDATQSRHRLSGAVCSTESREGGSKGEECVGTRKRRTGQGREREEKRKSILESGNPEKNASHVTPQSSTFPKQGVLWDASPPPVQRRTESERGKKIQVYLEESVIKCGKGANSEQEVVRTKVEQSLPIRRPKVPASVESGGGTARGATPTNGTESFHCAREALPLRQNTDTQLKPESQRKEGESDSMGRKNAARRKPRKSPQREAGGNSSTPEKGSLSASSAEGKGPKAEVGNSSSSLPGHTPPLSPQLKQGKTSCPDAVKLDKLPTADAAGGATAAQGRDGAADMDDDESLYKVERKTETPESKRRSMKTSRTEIKLFPKHVHLNPKKSDLDSNCTSSRIEDKGSSEPIAGNQPQ